MPILWQLFRTTAICLIPISLLMKSYTTGYAVKPIAGRCGSNMNLVSHQEKLLDKTSGKFAEQKNVSAALVLSKHCR
ncbi:hypothetical protein ACNKHK_19310 [Shigella flexneri]